MRKSLILNSLIPSPPVWADEGSVWEVHGQPFQAGAEGTRCPAGEGGHEETDGRGPQPQGSRKKRFSCPYY